MFARSARTIMFVTVLSLALLAPGGHSQVIDENVNYGVKD